MSFNSCSLLLLLLLCTSLHECNARRLAVYKNQPHDKFHISNQNGEKRVLVGASKAESSSSVMSNKAAKEDMKTGETEHKEERKGKESVVTVPWRVPHNKHEEKHPGFNLDYSPPKTHPPSHN